MVEEGRSGASYGAATATPKAEPESWAEAAQWCLDRNDELGMLNDRKREFVSDMAWNNALPRTDRKTSFVVAQHLGPPAREGSTGGAEIAREE